MDDTLVSVEFCRTIRNIQSSGCCMWHGQMQCSEVQVVGSSLPTTHSVSVPRRSYEATWFQSTKVSEQVTSFAATTKVRPWLRRFSQTHHAVGANLANRVSLKTELSMCAEIHGSELRLSLRRFSRNSKCPNHPAWIFCTTPNFGQIGTQIRTVQAEVRNHPSASRKLPNSRWTEKSIK